MVAQRFLVPLVGVRIPTGLPLLAYFPINIWRLYSANGSKVGGGGGGSGML
jgi:hypothetical protein